MEWGTYTAWSTYTACSKVRDITTREYSPLQVGFPLCEPSELSIAIISERPLAQQALSTQLHMLEYSACVVLTANSDWQPNPRCAPISY